MFANFALELLPEIASDVFTKFLDRFLCLNPVLKTEEMYESNRTFTFTCKYEWVLNCFFITPAESAISLFACSEISSCSYLDCLFKFLSINFVSSLCNFCAFEILNLEPYSTEFENIELLDFIVLKNECHFG